MIYEELFRELTQYKVRFAVTGGVALVLHGVVRFTADLDLIVDLSEDNLKLFLQVIKKLGYKTKQPIRPEDLLSPSIRKNWAEEKHMVVCTFYHPVKPLNIVDLFIIELIPFPSIEKEIVWFEAGGLRLPVVSKAHLKQLKRIANRPQDLADVAILEQLEREKE